MKTFLVLLLSTVLCYGQNFKMDMKVMEIYEDTLIQHDSIKVIWGVDQKGSISLVWDNPRKMLYLQRLNKYSSKDEREEMQNMLERYRMQPSAMIWDKYIRIMSFFKDEQNEMYFVTLYMQDGILIYISRVGDRTTPKDNIPCYLFGSLDKKQKS